MQNYLKSKKKNVCPKKVGKVEIDFSPSNFKFSFDHIYVISIIFLITLRDNKYKRVYRLKKQKKQKKLEL